MITEQNTSGRISYVAVDYADEQSRPRPGKKLEEIMEYR